MTNRRFVTRLALALIVATASALVGFVIARATTNEVARPIDGSAEAGFARDMSTHHTQAVAMADIIRRRTDDPELLLLATDIVMTQQHQIGQFAGWLDQWGLPRSSSAEPMAWVADHSEVGAHSMPGMVSNGDVQSLETLPIEQAQTRFIELMIGHHQGGVAMATAITTITSRPEVLRLARAIMSSQTNEIAVLQRLQTRLA